MEEDYDAVKKTEAIKESVMDIREAVGLAKEGKEEGFQYLYQETYQKSYYVALKYMKQEEYPYISPKSSKAFIKGSAY